MSERTLQLLQPELATVGTEVSIPAGAVLWKEGEPGDSLGLLLDGLLEVVHDDGEGVVVLRTMESGAVVGEISLDGRNRSNTVRARTAARMLTVSADDFREILRRRNDILWELYCTQVERVRTLTRQVTRTHYRAITDPLTRLYNWGFFRDRLDIEMERARHTGDVISLVIFDIDHFKHYNDNNGHQEGNEVLIAVADILKNIGRRGDILARYGGEEFVALLYGANREEAVRFAESARQAIKAQPFKGATAQPLGVVSVSCGVATFPHDARDDDDLIRVADDFLYKCKDGGRNRVMSASGVVADP